MASLQEVNMALVRALGFGDIKDFSGLVLQLSHDRPPVVTVQRIINKDAATAADSVATVVDRYELKPTIIAGDAA